MGRDTGSFAERGIRTDEKRDWLLDRLTHRYHILGQRWCPGWRCDVSPIMIAALQSRNPVSQITSSGLVITRRGPDVHRPRGTRVRKLGRIPMRCHKYTRPARVIELATTVAARGLQILQNPTLLQALASFRRGRTYPNLLPDIHRDLWRGYSF